MPRRKRFLGGGVRRFTQRSRRCLRPWPMPPASHRSSHDWRGRHCEFPDRGPYFRRGNSLRLRGPGRDGNHAGPETFGETFEARLQTTELGEIGGVGGFGGGGGDGIATGGGGLGGKEGPAARQRQHPYAQQRYSKTASHTAPEAGWLGDPGPADRRGAGELRRGGLGLGLNPYASLSAIGDRGVRL